jgi:hypothetical protein
MMQKRTVTQTIPAVLVALAALLAVVALLYTGCPLPVGGQGGGGGGSSSSLSALAIDVTAPGVITHLAAYTGNGTVTFSWQDPADDDFARVEIWAGASGTDGTAVGSAGRGKQTYKGTGAPGEVLYYHFISVDKTGNRSAAVNYMATLSPVTADVTNLTGTITGAGSVKFSWTDPVDPAFKSVTISTGGLPAQTVLKGLGSYTWKGLSDGTAYTFTVKAVYAVYTGNVSSTGVPVSLTLSYDEIPPGPVTDLSATTNGFGSVPLTWTNPNDADVQYVEITCEPFSGPAQTVSASPGAKGAYTWNGLAGGVTYTFTVKAVDDSGNRSAGVSDSGTPMDQTPPMPVTKLAGFPGNGSAVLFWTDPGDADLDYIQIDYGAGPQGPAKGTQSYTWSGLANGTAYTFTVKAVDTNGNRSEPVTVGPLTPSTSAEGTVSYAPVEGDPSMEWEIHTFTESGVLIFPTSTAITADYLIVAGGGGSGGDNSSYGNMDHSGGGGAGGLLYTTNGKLYPSGGVVQITVGAGGAGGTSGQQGADGGNSAIGTVAVPGGGAGGRATSNMNGRPGGSGGGGGSGSTNTRGVGGVADSSNPAVQGQNGGSGSGGGSGHDGGGGGGGAGGPGSNGGTGSGGAGGDSWDATAKGASWLVNATKTAEFPAGTNLFSHGGKGGDQNSPDGGINGAYYGDGGSAGKYNASDLPGGAGHSGIVVIRFKRAAAP